jgi:ABC-type polysaccharide/polyol phosphate export permease
VGEALRFVWGYRWFVYYMTSKSSHNHLYRSALGGVWHYLNPAVQMGIYWFLFVVVFQRQTPGLNPFLIIVTGITHYLFLNQCATAGSTSVSSKEQVLLQIRLEPLLMVAVTYFEQVRRLGFSLVIFALYASFMIDWSRWELMLYPVALVSLLLVAGCLTTIAGIMAVYMRDLSQIIPLTMRLGLYFSPVIYPVTFIPDSLIDLYLFNPIACLFACIQWTMMDVPAPGMAHLISMGCCMLALVVVTSWLYRKFAPTVTKAF